MWRYAIVMAIAVVLLSTTVVEAAEECTPDWLANQGDHAAAKAGAGLAGGDHPGRGEHGLEHRFHGWGADLIQVARSLVRSLEKRCQARLVSGRERRGQIQHTLVLLDDEAATFVDYCGELSAMAFKLLQADIAEGFDIRIMEAQD